MSTPLQVLIVEDSEDDALLLLRELRRGYGPVVSERVDTVAAMEAALEEKAWDLVISDHSMPAFSSLDALDLLRRKGLAELPFIIVSGQIGEDVAVEAMRAGAHDYIMKGNLARLNTAIERELREVEVRRERRRAEEALKTAEEKYRGIFENAVEGIFQTTAEGRLTTANPALAHMFGYESPKELLDAISDVGDQLYVEPERRAELDQLLQEHGAVSGFEIQVYRKDGSMMSASVSTRAVRDADGEIAGYEGTVEDITKRKRAEAALREIREAERRRIARDLHDEALQDLFYVLQSLRLNQAVSAGEEASNGGLEREITALQRAIAGLRNAVYDLRLEAGQGRTFLQSLRSLLELNRHMAPEQTLELVVEEGFPAEFAGTTGLELLRIIREALVNVRRHSGASHARVTLARKEDGIRAEVEDDGRGLEPGKGTGTGFTGMQERANALGGELKIWSVPGKGTKVCFCVASHYLSASGAGSRQG
jgi:two-component system, NarL family, sensor histidine kinase UhpB